VINPYGYFEDELLKTFQNHINGFDEDERYLEANRIVEELKTEK